MCGRVLANPARSFSGSPQSKSGERLCANVRQFAQRLSLWHRAIMQDIIPGKIDSREPDLPEGAGNGLAIGDMQH